MKETARKGLISCGVNAGIALLLALAVALKQGLTAAQSFQKACGDLSDGFFVAGLILISIGTLSCIASTGFFDIFAFGGRTFLSHFVPRMNNEETRKYYDFKAARDEKRKPPLRTTLYVGLVCIAISLAFLGLYYI